MRITLAVLLFLTVALAPVGVLTRALAEAETAARTATARSGTTLTWPADSRVADPAWALRELQEIADRTHCNVSRLVVTSPPDGRTHYSHFVLLERSDSRMLDALRLDRGRWITLAESAAASAITATVPLDDLPRVGVPAVLGHGYDLTVAPLGVLFDRLPAAGRYTIDAPSGERDREFRDNLVRAFQQRGLTEWSDSDLTPEPTGTAGPDTENAAPISALTLLPVPLGALAALLSGALLLRSGKPIGVMSLFGLPAGRIWFRIVGRVQCLVAMIAVLTWAVILVALPGSDAALAGWVLATVASAAAIAALASGAVGALVFRRLRVSGLLTGVLS